MGIASLDIAEAQRRRIDDWKRPFGSTILDQGIADPGGQTCSSEPSYQDCRILRGADVVGAGTFGGLNLASLGAWYDPWGLLAARSRLHTQMALAQYVEPLMQKDERKTREPL